MVELPESTDVFSYYYKGNIFERDRPERVMAAVSFIDYLGPGCIYRCSNTVQKTFGLEV